MKKISIITALAILAMSTGAFAAGPKSARAPEPQKLPRPTANKINAESGVAPAGKTVVNPGLNSGVSQSTSILDNSVTAAAGSVARTKLLKGMCANIPGITASQRAEVDFADANGLGTGNCLATLAGSPEAVGNGLSIIAAGNIVFKREARDTNADGQVNAADITDDLGAKMLAAQADAINEPLNKTNLGALEVLETTSPNCNLPSPAVGTTAAFAQARRLLN